MSGLRPIMAKRAAASKAFAVRNRHVRVMAGATLARTEGRNIGQNDSRNAKPGAPDSHAANPIPVCSHRER
jgi:hypothetical protein